MIAWTRHTAALRTDRRQCVVIEADFPAKPLFQCLDGALPLDLDLAIFALLLLLEVDLALEELLVDVVGHRLVEQVNELFEANHREGARVATLKKQRKETADFLGRVMDAIEQGGDVPQLIARAKARQAELADLDRQISELQSELKPLLVPRAPEEFSDGGAALFDDPVAARKQVWGDVQRLVLHGDGGLILFFHPESLFAPLTNYGFDLDAEDEVRDLGLLRQRHMVGATSVSAGGAPFVVEDGGRILYAATVTMPPGFDSTQDDPLETSSASKRSQRPQRDSNPFTAFPQNLNRVAILASIVREFMWISDPVGGCAVPSGSASGSRVTAT